jgi:hypothetical protein
MSEAADELTQKLERLGRELLDQFGSREGVSVALGYFPAWKAYFYKETFGLPLIEQMLWAKRHGLRMDWGGLEYEFGKHGKAIEVIEAKRFSEKFL